MEGRFRGHTRTSFGGSAQIRVILIIVVCWQTEDRPTQRQDSGSDIFMRQARGGHFMDGKTRERKRDKLHQFIIRIRGYRRQVAILIERSEGELAGCLYSGADPLQNVCCIPVY